MHIGLQLYDERLRSLHLPTTIQRIRINPLLVAASAPGTQQESFHLDSSIRPRPGDQSGITGDVTLYNPTSRNAAIQIQGATYLPLGGSAEEQDRRVFSKVHWIRSHPDGLEAAGKIQLTDQHRNMVLLLERIATFYLRTFERDVAPDDPKRSEFPTNWYLNYAQYISRMVQAGRHKWTKTEWLNDTLDDVLEASKPFQDVVDVQIRALDAIVQKLYMMRLSEEDWHQAILEGIDASRLESPNGPEITTGLSDVPFEIPNAPTWYNNPKFSDFIVHLPTEDKDAGSGKTSVSIQDLLQRCNTQDDVLEVVERKFEAHSTSRRYLG